MAEISKFFNSAPGDPRTYQASDFADYFGSVLSTGLLHTDNIPALEVKCDGNDLRTYVTPGKAIIQGYLYENTSNLYLEHALPEPTLDRIDRIVLRLDKRNQSRYIRLFVKQGVPSSNPVPPELQRDDFIYELSLAQIRVRANTSTLNPADLIDERLDENLCGLVHSLISIPTSQFQAQWDLYFNAKKDEIDAETLNYLQQLASNIASFEQEWDTWFSGIQNEGFASAEEFNAHLADNAAHGIGDKSTLLTSNKNTIVEAINELFTFANDGKSSIATVIGSPATNGDTFSQLATHITNHKNALASSLGSGSGSDSLQTLVNTRLQGLKNTLATNLTNKGQSSNGSETLQNLINKVASITTGKRFLTGSVTSSSAGEHFSSVTTAPYRYSVVVNGLTFKPSIILVYTGPNTERNGSVTVYKSGGVIVRDGILYEIVETMHSYYDSDTYGEMYRATTPAYVTSSGFKLPVQLSNQVYDWIAIE